MPAWVPLFGRLYVPLYGLYLALDRLLLKLRWRKAKLLSRRNAV